MKPGDNVGFLHVANGTSTTRQIQLAGIPGACSIWADPLYEGPVPAGVSDRDLIEVRARYLTGSGDAPSSPSPETDPDITNDLRQWRAAIERSDSYDELILWFEHDLFDQLNLIQLLTFIRGHVPAATPVSLICIGSFPGRPDFKGLGELTPQELAPLLKEREPVVRAHYELAERAWLAFRAPTPESLDALRHQETSALPYLAPAICRFLEEYPWARDGLSRTERRLLTLADGDGMALSELFPRMHVGERAYYVTDASLDAMARTLSDAVPPLLTFDRPARQSDRVLQGRVRLTDAGRAVLSGELDRIGACGIDRWLGGVHLQSGGTIWRWDDARQRIA